MDNRAENAPLSIWATALAGAAVGLIELAWLHHADGPFETGSVWLAVAAVALGYAAVSAVAAVLVKLIAGLRWPALDRASVALPLAVALPVVAHLLEQLWSHWSPLPTRALELAVLLAGSLVAVTVLGSLARVAPVLASPRLYLSILAVGAVYVAFQPQTSLPTPRTAEPRAGSPSALLITIDTLRADGLGAYGHEAARTPVLDGLAEQGVLFEHAITSSVLTGPSHMTILSGLLPMQHGVIENSQRLPLEIPTVAEILSAEGWDTGAIVSGYPVSQRASRLLGRFNSWDDDMRGPCGLGGLGGRAVPRLIWDLSLGRTVRRLLEPTGFDPLPKWRKAESVSSSAVEWLEHGDDPFFAWVHYYDPHLPYEAPDELVPAAAKDFEGPRGEDWYHLDADQRRAVVTDAGAVARMRQLYDAEIALVDSELGRVIAAARERAGDAGLWILVTSDHGEAFGEHGIWYRRELYDDCLRVPLILGTPDDGPKAVRIADQVRLIDVAPTLLDALGVDRELDGEGVSLLPLARGFRDQLPGPGISAIYTSHADPYQRFLLSVRNGRWKSLWRAEGWANSDALWAPEGRELYDLAADADELHDRYGEHPDLWQSLRDRAGEVQLDMRSTDTLSPEALEALELLGYTD